MVAPPSSLHLLGMIPSFLAALPSLVSPSTIVVSCRSNNLGIGRSPKPLVVDKMLPVSSIRLLHHLVQTRGRPHFLVRKGFRTLLYYFFLFLSSQMSQSFWPFFQGTLSLPPTFSYCPSSLGNPKKNMIPNHLIFFPNLPTFLFSSTFFNFNLICLGLFFLYLDVTHKSK